jgi:predicted transcriptional regulator
MPARTEATGAGVVLELSAAQVDQVVVAATSASGIRAMLLGLTDPPSSLEIDPSSFEDLRLSRSLLSGLLVLAAFPRDRSYVSNTEIAEMLGMSITTTHRYVSTLLAAGLVERDPNSRKYRLGSRAAT